PRLAAGRAGGGARAGGGGAAARLPPAADRFTKLALPIGAGGVGPVLAHEPMADDPPVALDQAARALATFEDRGARHLADQAAALVRDLGGPARTGRKDVGVLTEREVEVLRLLGEGLSNAEIAARLFISTKTAGHHVSNILAKLQLKSRQEAAAYAVRTLDPEPHTTSETFPLLPTPVRSALLPS